MSAGDGNPIETAARELAQMSPSARKAWARGLASDLKEVRRQLREAKKDAAQAIRQAQARCREGRKRLREQRKHMRETHKREFRALLEKERAYIHNVCNTELGRIKAANLSKVAQVKARETALLRKKDQLDTLTGAFKSRMNKHLKDLDRRMESDDAVRTELEKAMPEAVGWWNAHKDDKRFAPRKVPARTSRAEFVIEALEAEPEQLLRWQEHHAEKRVKELEAAEAEKAKMHARRHRVMGRAERIAARTMGRANRQKAERGTSYARDIRAGEAAPF